MFNHWCSLEFFSCISMPPNKLVRAVLQQSNAPSPTLAELHEADLFYEGKARETHLALERHALCWVDLPPYTQQAPSRPPKGDEVKVVEESVTPDKRLKLVYVIGGCEMASWQLDPFLNEDGSLLSVAPHRVNRYVLGGPVDPGLFGPVSADFVRFVNKSVIGQSWHEVSVASVDRYVSDWCDSRPDVTVLCLGFWDVVLGLVVWTKDCVTPGVYGRYVIRHLELFLTCARHYCYRNRIDYDAWMVGHTFLLVSIPNWAQLTPDIVSRDTISIETWQHVRRRCFVDMYDLEKLLWAKYNAIVFTPKVPVESLGAQGYFYMLGCRYSRLYIAQILAVVAKVCCVRPACRLPADCKAMKCLINDRPCRDKAREDVLRQLGTCGRFFARFVPIGKTFREMYELGHY